MTSFTGSNPERQSVGLPGHCDACADRGHVDAHPDLGCSDVGCSSMHPEPVEATPAESPVAPMVALISHDGAPPRALTSLGWRSWDQQVPMHVFDLLHRVLREAPLRVQSAPIRDVAPTGWHYTSTGAHSLDAVLAAMWATPEADVMRDLPQGPVYGTTRDPWMAVLERAQGAMFSLWADFLTGIEEGVR